MKKWMKQVVYRLLGDSRRDIIRDITDELKREKEEMKEEVCSLREQLSQYREWVGQEFIRQEYAKLDKQLHIHIDMAARDTHIILSQMSVPGNPLHQEAQYELHTDYPVAYESPDHLHPWGTRMTIRGPHFLSKNVNPCFLRKDICALQTSAAREGG